MQPRRPLDERAGAICLVRISASTRGLDTRCSQHQRRLPAAAAQRNKLATAYDSSIREIGPYTKREDIEAFPQQDAPSAKNQNPTKPKAMTRYPASTPWLYCIW